MNELEEQGWAVIPKAIDEATCDELVALYPVEAAFRSRVVMARHGFGRGEYQYLRYPLPSVVSTLRERWYCQLVGIANRWNERLASAVRYPATHAEYLTGCHAAGQTHPTPLILKYGAGDYNCLHQDMYGEHVFPLQVAFLLSQPEEEFGGGELVLTEQRPRMQSRAQVVALKKGDAAVFAVNQRPRRGSNGDYRVKMRHGVSRVEWGRRFTLGLIFHDAAG